MPGVIAWGESVAEQILDWRANDGSEAMVAPPTGSGPGVWVPTPPAFAAYLLPQWVGVTPFVMTDGSDFRPPGPPALDSAKYIAEYDEVKTLGAKVGSTRTPEQDLIALFWADGAGTETPPGHWNSIAQDVGAALGNTMEQNARLFALLNIAMADAAICAWDAKYFYHFWRPVTTTGSDFLPGVSRRFMSFPAAASEAAISRLYGGIHFRSANEDGLVSGVQIGELAFTHYMQPKGNRSRQ